jgi:hypothetical protein
MIHSVLVAAVLVVLYCLFVLVVPHGRCPRCKNSAGKRRGMCRKCGGTRKVQRFGAPAVHRFFWSVAGTLLHDRLKDRVEAAKERSGVLRAVNREDKPRVQRVREETHVE